MVPGVIWRIREQRPILENHRHNKKTVNYGDFGFQQLGAPFFGASIIKIAVYLRSIPPIVMAP